MSGLVQALKKGEPWAVTLTLKTRCGWHDTNAQRFVDEKGRDRPFLLSDADRLIAEADAEDGGK